MSDDFWRIKEKHLKERTAGKAENTPYSMSGKVRGKNNHRPHEPLYFFIEHQHLLDTYLTFTAIYSFTFTSVGGKKRLIPCCGLVDHGMAQRRGEKGK